MRFAPILPLMLLACTPIPDLGLPQAELAHGAYPRILPASALVAPDPPADIETQTRNLQSRAASLRARAALLRRPVASQQDLDAMRAGLPRG